MLGCKVTEYFLTDQEKSKKNVKKEDFASFFQVFAKKSTKTAEHILLDVSAEKSSGDGCEEIG